jgi:hypothetical protein
MLIEDTCAQNFLGQFGRSDGRDPGSGGQLQNKFSGKFFRMSQDEVGQKKSASPNLGK